MSARRWLNELENWTQKLVRALGSNFEQGVLQGIEELEKHKEFMSRMQTTLFMGKL